MPKRNPLTPQPFFSEEDSDLAKYWWSFLKKGYARRTFFFSPQKPSLLFAHRIVVSRMIGRPLKTLDYCDHINRNKMDNRRENLRVGSPKKNNENRSCGYHHGVSHIGKDCKKPWQARVRHNGKFISCGYFSTAEEGMVASAKKRVQLGWWTDKTCA